MASLITDPKSSEAVPGPCKPGRECERSGPLIRKIAQYGDEFIVYDDEYRGWTYRYSEIGRLAGAFALRLRASAVTKGSSLMIWSESRPGWVVALWGCVLEGAVVVPVDPRSR